MSTSDPGSSFSEAAVPPLLEAMQGGGAGFEPARQAIVERAGSELAVTTYGELAGQVAAASAWLAERGVGEGDVVAVWLPNWAEAVVMQFALAGLGAAALGVNTRYSVHEVENLLRRGRPRGIVMPSRFLTLDFVDRLVGAWQAARTDGDLAAPWVAAVRGEPDPAAELGGGLFALPDFAAAAEGWPSAGFFADRLATCFTTSGSSGPPKLAGHSQAAVATHSRNVVEAFAMDAESVFLTVLPLSGVFGFNPAMGALAAGGSLLLEPTFDIPQILADMEKVAVTHAVGGDDMLGRLMDGWEPGALTSSVRRVGIADFVGRSREFATWAEREWGAKVGGVYGSSEVFALTATWPPELSFADRTRGGGRIVSTAIEVRAADPETDAECAIGELGELQFRGYNVTDAYLGTPELLAAATTEDGWFRSGDLGTIEPGGREFVYVCRRSDALRLRGFLVEPEEIEAFLMTHPSVETVRVVGARGSAGDVAVGFVKLADGEAATTDDLLDFCRGRLAPFKVPTRVELVDEFPVTAGTNGTKIKNDELRRRAAELIGAR